MTYLYVADVDRDDDVDDADVPVDDVADDADVDVDDDAGCM